MLKHKLNYKKKKTGILFEELSVFIYNTGYCSKNWKTLSALNIQGIRFACVHWA